MASVEWPLRDERPVVTVQLRLAVGGYLLLRTLLADTGAGSRRDPFELILDEDDCLQCGGIPTHDVRLGGAFVGSFPLYLVDVEIPELAFLEPLPVVGVPTSPKGFDGLACFRFLSRFHFGNFGNPSKFGLVVQ